MRSKVVCDRDREMHPVIELKKGEDLPRIICSYCGARYFSTSQEAVGDAIREHIESCEKHPLAKALVRVKQLEAEVDDLQAKLRQASRVAKKATKKKAK